MPAGENRSNFMKDLRFSASRYDPHELCGLNFHEIHRSVICHGTCEMKTATSADVAVFWCPRPDSNRHASRHYPLKIACLPIPPLGPGVIVQSKSGESISIRTARVKKKVRVFVFFFQVFPPSNFSKKSRLNAAKRSDSMAWRAPRIRSRKKCRLCRVSSRYTSNSLERKR